MLDFAKRLRDRIEKSGKYRVLMTRTDDTFVPLADRVRIARNAGAALFVSIHADWLSRKEGDAQGATVYTLSETATDPAAARLAEEENRADVIAGVDLKAEPDDVAGILIDLAQRETKTFSVQFAHKLVGELKDATRLHKEPIKSAGFRVLRAPDVPSVLVELGYVSNKQDLQSLLSDSWRDHTADAMAAGHRRLLLHPPCRGARRSELSWPELPNESAASRANGLSLNKKPSDERANREDQERVWRVAANAATVARHCGDYESPRAVPRPRRRCTASAGQSR